jgi:hypothetical protein
VKTGRKLPVDVVDHWPEIFGEVTLNVVPLNYLHTIQITFKNKKVWEIEFSKEEKISWDDVQSQLKSLVAQYEDAIDSVDFKLDTIRIKKDISAHTKKFLKNKKLK